MKIKDKLTVPLYEKSFDGDSYYSYIKFENMDVILSAQEKIAKQFSIDFYEWMDDNYKRIGDGFVTRMSLDKIIQ